MKYKLKYIYSKIKTAVSTHWFLCALLLSSCAQIVAPAGGKQDKTPPRVVKYVPDSASLNFTAKSIVIFFDEFIQLRELSNQLIISPPLANAPDIKVKNKELIINFDKNEILKPNATYCLSFGTAVQDIHENNAIDNFKYIFSTGSFIDSSVVKGKVENAFDHKTEKDILVMLYTDFSDSVIYKKRPDYFTKTKDDGTFQINNVHAGKYKLLALKDANANYKYDGDNEKIGFVNAPIDVLENKKILIDMFQEPQKKLYLKKTVYNSYGRIMFVFNKTADSISIQPTNYTFKKNEVFADFSKNKDTLNYWFKNFDKDSLFLLVKNGSKVMDTLSFKIISKETALKNKKNPLKLLLISSPKGSKTVDLNSELKLTFNNPLDPELFNKTPAGIKLTEDSIPYKLPLLESINNASVKIGTLMSNGKQPQSGTLQGDEAMTPIVLKENAGYNLFIPPGTFTDFFGLTNDTIKIDFKTREEKFYGSLKLTLQLPETSGNYIVQLLDEAGNPARVNNVKKSEIITYQYLLPQKYTIKVIYDMNGDFKWNTGNLLQKMQPEKVVFNADPITIRSNWDMDLEWKLLNN